MRLGIVQSSPVFGDVESNIQGCIDLMASGTADLWVLPELFATGYQFRDPEEARSFSERIPEGDTTQALIRYARASGCHIAAGLPETDGPCVYNAAVLVGPNGLVATYRKVHLFYEETLNFSPGNRPYDVFDLGIAKVGIMVCFDHLFPEAARSLALQGAEIIVHPSNLVMPDMAQRTMRVRALENGVYAATANRVGTESRGDESLSYTGQSQSVAPNGRMLIQLSPDRPEIGVVEIDPSEARNKAVTQFNDKLGDRRPDLYCL
jgi:5-aminopentanamidase